MKRLVSILSVVGAAVCGNVYADFIHLENAQAFAELIKRDKLVALFVYPPGQPCKNILAAALKVSKEKDEKDVTFVVVDIRSYGALKNQYQVGKPPTTILFSNGIELSRFYGQMNTSALKDFMTRGFLGNKEAFMKNPITYTSSWIKSHFTHPQMCEDEGLGN